MTSAAEYSDGTDVALKRPVAPSDPASEGYVRGKAGFNKLLFGVVRSHHTCLYVLSVER